MRPKYLERARIAIEQLFVRGEGDTVHKTSKDTGFKAGGTIPDRFDCRCVYEPVTIKPHKFRDIYFGKIVHEGEIMRVEGLFTLPEPLHGPKPEPIEFHYERSGEAESIETFVNDPNAVNGNGLWCCHVEPDTALYMVKASRAILAEVRGEVRVWRHTER